MSRKSVLVIDDEDHGRVLVKQYLAPYADFYVAGECSNGVEAVKFINMIEPDLIFLDIQMPGASGFEVLQRIDHVPDVIFTTAFDKYAIKAFEINVIDYLLKPYTKERFDQTIARLKIKPGFLPQLAMNTFPGAQRYPERIMVAHQNRFKNISVHDIMYLKADGDYTEIYTDERSYLSSFGISAIAQKFDPAKFVRIHRSVIVNLSYVRELYRDIGKTFLVLDNGLEFTVGRSYLSAVKCIIV
ncbi:LytTR family DNA-binding domain-containing protein [Pedobacter heparinus]|uniref:LytR/AlgR family response regulator transcription factor n=1 Tax=Pedobacter heparinus TaxID=984 RepID=UPI00292D66A7|nr:LytTR family DNA-binding domain-containing protein [Pedobacter heparinus]